MKIIEGDYVGKRGRFVHAAFRGPRIQISGRPDVKLPDDVERLKILSRTQERTAAQMLVLLLLALTIIGIPIALIALFLWKQTRFTVGVRLKDGSVFVAAGDDADWPLASYYDGLGELSDWKIPPKLSS